MATAGLGVLALVAGTAGGIAALTSDDTRVTTVVERAAPVVDLPAAEVPGPAPVGQAGRRAGAGPAPGAGPVNGPVNGPVPGLTGSAQAEKEADDTRAAPGEADRTATRSPRRPNPVAGGLRVGPVTGGGAVAPVRGAPAAAPVPGLPPGPVVRKVRVSETAAVPFRTRTVRDSSLRSGVRQVRTAGAPGERRLRYEITYTGSQETGRRLLDSTITRAPRDRVVAVGTKVRVKAKTPPKRTVNRHDDRRDNNDDDSDDDDDDGGRWSIDDVWPSGGWFGGGGWRDRGCRFRESCVRMSRDAGCDESDGDSILDGDLRDLDLSELEDLRLDLPCEESGRVGARD